VREGEDSLANKYKIKSYPSLVVIKAEGKPIKYTGKEFSYKSIFEFLNVHSQVFIDPNAAENAPSQTNAASKPWLVVQVPQMTQDSANDICLKKDGSLCVVLVVPNKAALNENTISEMNKVGQAYESKISRGINFIFSWLDASEEPEFANTFELPEPSQPALLVLNPGKRKRFLLHEGAITESTIGDTLDKILGGDARFKNIKGNKLPELVSMYPTE